MTRKTPPGVRIRRAGEPRPAKYRRRPEPQGPFFEEATDEAMREADQHKAIGINCGRKRR